MPYNLDDIRYDCEKHINPALLSNNVIKNPNGTISVFEPKPNGPVTPYPLTKECCKVLAELSNENYFFDLNQQQCMWRTNSIPCVDSYPPIKIILNPKGNDGSIFEINGDENCSLNVKFDYLIKLNCEALSETVFNKSQLNNSKETEEIVGLKNKLEDQTTKCEVITSEIDFLSKEFLNLNYSIVCDDFPDIDNPNAINETSGDTVSLTETQKLPFSKTGFGNLAPMSFALMNKTITFCLTEPYGLDAWKKIIGIDAYQKFLAGDITSYTTKNVIDLYNENLNSVKKSKIEYIFECETPFGYKTEVLNKINGLIKKQKNCKTKIGDLNNKLSVFNVVNEINDCGTVIDYFENFSANMCIDLVNNDNSLTTIYETTLFQNIGSGNLYNYLISHSNNSGFYVCGQPNENETWASGCTSITYPELTQEPLTQNVSSCLTVKDIILDSLFTESNYQDFNSFLQTLSPNILSSQWLNFSISINDPTFINQIANNKIKLSINVNNNCGNFCVLVDSITLQRECNDVQNNTIFISQSPGFNLTKVVDNKKSWLNNSIFETREFEVNNLDITNPIRQTNYNLNDERLIINTKEIDLNMDIASAVEYNVWCYINENPCLLSGKTNECITEFKPTDMYGNEITLPKNYEEPPFGLGFSEYVPRMVAAFVSNSIYSDIYTPELFPQIESNFCGKVIKFMLKRINTGNFWIVCADDKLNLFYIDDITDVQNTIYNLTDLYILGDGVSSGKIIADTYFYPAIDLSISVTNALIKDRYSYLKPYEVFWSDLTLPCCPYYPSCGDNDIDFLSMLNEDLTKIETNEKFKELMMGLVDVKSRKVLSGYPTLKAVYDRYMTSNLYCDTLSSQFDYYNMDKFVGLINNYWDDLIEQVIPATTLWGSVKVYTNTLFDTQKFKYKSYSALFCNDPLNQIGVPSPINGISGQCENVEIITNNIQTYDESGDVGRFDPNTQVLNKLCISQMNWGSEFIGNVSIMDGNNNTSYYSDFCTTPPCNKSASWYNMQESPDFIMGLSCGVYPTDDEIFNFSASSFSINGTELITTAFTVTITADTVNWIPANNDVISGCTLGNPTGVTYTDFVDFLNYVFTTLNVDYEARISLVQRDLGSNSKSGFYIIFPQDDVFVLKTASSNTYFGYDLVYSNNSLTNGAVPQYYKMTTDVDYDCLTNTINE